MPTALKLSVTQYHDCANLFVNDLVRANGNNLRCVVLYGGLVRDPNPILGWSDIDLIAIFRDMSKRCVITLAQLINARQAAYGIRIDLTQIEDTWITKPHLRQHLYDSEVINALAMRSGVSKVLYGDLPAATFAGDHELLAARFYISNTLALFRRYLVENVFAGPQPCDRHAAVTRITRWTFSIIRASLRLFDIYVHPYGPSLLSDGQVRTYPAIDIRPKEELTGLALTDDGRTYVTLKDNAVPFSWRMLSIGRPDQSWTEEKLPTQLGQIFLLFGAEGDHLVIHHKDWSTMAFLKPSSE
jgi:hypothetical protein